MFSTSKVRFVKISSVFLTALIIFMNQGTGLPSAVASPAKNGDFGIWNTYDIEKKLNPKWKLWAGEELRFRDHNGIYYAETHVGADYKPSKYLAMGLLYLENRVSQTKKEDTNWYWESEPRIYMTPQFSFKGFLVENRNMMVFRWRQESKFILRYRNMTTLTLPWKFTRFEFQPYVANEIFVAMQQKGMYEDRFYSGLKVHWWGPVYGSIFYLRHATKNSIGKWTALNILGTSLKISF